MPVPLRTDDRGVSEVIGAVLLFGMLIIALATYQATIIPGQNTDIEAQHYEEVQGDLGKLQGTIVTAAETGEPRSTSVNLGPSYPSRALGVNSGPPSGQLRAESVGTGKIESTGVPLDETCRLQAGGGGRVPTNALVYDPGYNYYESGDVSHRLEETLLYQPESAYGGEIARNDQTMVDPRARSVTLYPLQSDLQSGGIGDETYRFIGGYGQSRTVSDATITIPTRASLTIWQEQIDDGNPDISVTNNGAEAVSITFTGSWEFNCRPVGQGSAPEQVPTADAGTDTSVPEGSTVELDGTESQASGSIADYSWTLTGSPPTGVSLSDSNAATPIFDASDANVPSDTDVTVELTVTDTNGYTDTDTVTVTVTQTSGSGDGGASLMYNDDAVNYDGPDPDSVAGGVNFSVTNRFGESVTITDIGIAPENSSISTLNDNVDLDDKRGETEVFIDADPDDTYVDYMSGIGLPGTVDLDTDGRNDGGNAILSEDATATFYLYEFTDGTSSVDMSGKDVELTVTYQPASGGIETKTFTITPTGGRGGGGVTYLEADDGSANTAPTAIDLEEGGSYDGTYEAARIGIVNTKSEQIDRVNSITVELPNAPNNIKRIDAPSGDRDSYGAEVYFAGNNNDGYIDLSSDSISLGDEASFESGSGSRQVGDIDSNSGIVVKLSQFRKSGGGNSGGGNSGSDADMSGKDIRLTINFEAGGSTYTETVSVTLDNQAQA